MVNLLPGGLSIKIKLTGELLNFHSKLAKLYLAPPPTSTNNCERLFSIAGQVMDEKRATLLPERLDKILFLRENIKSANFNLDWGGED